MDVVERARALSERAHKEQVRKYTGEPYFNHCKEVAEIVASVGGSDEMIAAAYLHDTVEDTDMGLMELIREVGSVVAMYVYWLTDVSAPQHGNRKIRKEIDRQHTAAAPPEAKTIKLADLISNTRSIVEHDPHFARVYLREKERLLEVLSEGNAELFKQAGDLLIQSKIRLLG